MQQHHLSFYKLRYSCSKHGHALRFLTVFVSTWFSRTDSLRPNRKFCEYGKTSCWSSTQKVFNSLRSLGNLQTKTCYTKNGLHVFNKIYNCPKTFQSIINFANDNLLLTNKIENPASLILLTGL